ncbi:MAG: DUF362 domain-containing protein [Candidatus Hodarchaeota archaeon]
MNKRIVAIVPYEKPVDSVRKAVDLCHGLKDLPPKAKVFIKPNICFWRRAAVFPKWGVITTSRVVEDMVVLLKERGIEEIIIGEGMVLLDPQDKATPADAFESLGYNVLRKRYGVKILNIYERPFEKVELGSGVDLNFNADFLRSDFVVNIPVLKTHVQTVVSLGIKNLKGIIDVESRKICHNANQKRNLNYMIARLTDNLPPSFTILDGIYTNEIGPSFEGTIRRSNILVASSDLLSADMVGAKILGHEPSAVAHLTYAALNRKRPVDLSDVEVVGEKIEDVASFHEYALPYDEEAALPMSLARMGVRGLTIPRYDLSVCTYCTILLPAILFAITEAWKGEPWENVEILIGKIMQPTHGKKKTILLGKCMYRANKESPDIAETIAVKGCPPQPKTIVKALSDAGIEVNPSFFEILNMSGVLLMQRYGGKPEFEETLFRIV